VLRQIVVKVPLTAASFPAAIQDYIKTESGTAFDLTAGPIIATKNGSVVLTSGAVSCEIMTDDVYFLPRNTREHSPESIEGFYTQKTLDLNGDNTVNLYSYDSDYAYLKVFYI
jgi:hypothetical protein